MNLKSTKFILIYYGLIIPPTVELERTKSSYIDIDNDKAKSKFKNIYLLQFHELLIRVANSVKII